MRLRALLFLTSILAMGAVATNASAVTLFTSTAHTTRVALGSTLTATQQGTLDLTVGGSVVNRCTHSTLHLDVRENGDERVALTVTSGSFPGCLPNPVTPTFDWTLTVTGNPVVVGPSTAWPATADNVAFDLVGVPGAFTANLENLTVTQPTIGTSPLCLDLDNAGPFSGPIAGGRIDGKYCFTTGVSLT
jgi:hypothetical protein